MNNAQPLLQLEISSDRDRLPGIRTQVRELSQAEGFDEQAICQIVLAVDEALSNVIQHAYDGRKDQPIHVEFCRMSEGSCCGLRVCIRDYGRQVDPRTIRSRDLADIRPGGLGVHIMRSIMDEVVYARAVDRGMLLTMTKWQQRADGSERAT